MIPDEPLAGFDEAVREMLRPLSDPAPTVTPMHGPLTRDQAMLELEQQWFRYEAVKETVVRERFEVSLTRYFQRLNWYIETPAAIEHDPLTVKRLLRLRDERRARRRGRVG